MSRVAGLSPTSVIGSAAVHFACADLLLAGYAPTLAIEGASYDLILDTGTALLRVQVKGTESFRTRSRAVPGWGFNTSRNARPNRRAEPATMGNIDTSHCDILALVIIPERRVAYLPVLGKMPAMIWLYAEDVARFTRGGSDLRRRVSDLPIDQAIYARDLALEQTAH